MSEQPNDETVTTETVTTETVKTGDVTTRDEAIGDEAIGDEAIGDEARHAGATSQDFGNLSVEDDAEGTVDPAELAGTAGPDAHPRDGSSDG